MNPTASLSATDRFAMIIDALCRAVAARSFRGALAGALIIVIWARLRRINDRVQALAGRFRAGTLRVRDGSPCVLARRPGLRSPCLVTPYSGLPRQFGWLLQLVPVVAAGCASQLRHLLADPEMAALLTASPQVMRILRPLCRMLGLEAGLLVVAPAVASGDAVAGDLVIAASVAVPAFSPVFSPLSAVVPSLDGAGWDCDPEGPVLFPA